MVKTKTRVDLRDDDNDDDNDDGAGIVLSWVTREGGRGQR